MPSCTVNLENEWSALLLQCYTGFMASGPPQVATSSVKLFQIQKFSSFSYCSDTEWMVLAIAL